MLLMSASVKTCIPSVYMNTWNDKFLTSSCCQLIYVWKSLPFSSTLFSHSCLCSGFFFPRKYMLVSRALFSRSYVVFGFVYPTLWVCVVCVCVVAIDRNPFHIAQWKMEFLYGFTTVRHAHFHMQANRIDFSLFVFTIVTQSSSHSLTPIYRGHSGNSSIFVYIHMFYSLLQRNENKLFSSSMIFTRLALRQCIRLIDIELEILRLPFCCIFPCPFRVANWFSRLQCNRLHEKW